MKIYRQSFVWHCLVILLFSLICFEFIITLELTETLNVINVQSYFFYLGHFYTTTTINWPNRSVNSI